MVLPPPCIHSMTGSLAAFGGDQIFRYKQSSSPVIWPGGACSPAPLSSDANCGHMAPGLSAWWVCWLGSGGCGARQRSLPTGGSAKGMPCQLRAPNLSMKPTTSPPSVLRKVVALATTGASGSGCHDRYICPATMTKTPRAIRTIAAFFIISPPNF